MKKTTPKILVFDSGLGGISILDAIRAAHPGCHFIYCTDNAAFPYGTKPENNLIERVSKVMSALNSTFRPDIFVVACNTASTVALPKIRSMITVPVIGVVPAIKPAARIAKTDCIGLLATPATIKRDYTNELITEYGQGLTWIKVGSSSLVEAAERKMYGEDPPDIGIIRKALGDLGTLPTGKIDTIVLACTHFPLLRDELKVALPHIKNWVDSSEAIARRAGFWLHELGYQPQEVDKSIKHELVFTVENTPKEKIDKLLASIQFKKSSTLIVE